VISGLSEKLGRFLGVDGISVVAVVSRDGFVIDSVGRCDVDLDSLGLMVATADDLVSHSQTFVELGFPHNKIFRNKKKKVLMAQVADEILALIVDESESPESLSSCIKLYFEQIVEILAPSELPPFRQKKVYRYASDVKSDGLQELSETIPITNLDEPDAVLNEQELDELVMLSAELFSMVDGQSTFTASDDAYAHFLILMNRLHCMLQSPDSHSGMIDVIVQMRSIFIDADSDYYRILALPDQAESEAIKNQFGLFKDLYSFDDRIDPDYTCILKISKAFLVLRSPAKRWLYDSKRVVGKKGRQVVRQIAHNEWLQSEKALAAKSAVNSVKKNLNNDAMKKLRNRSSHALRSVISGIKGVYASQKKHK